MGFMKVTGKYMIEQQYLPAGENLLRTHPEDFGTIFIFD